MNYWKLLHSSQQACKTDEVLRTLGNKFSPTIPLQFTILWVHMEYLEGFSMTPQSLLSNLCFRLDASCSRPYNLLTHVLFLRQQKGYQLELSPSVRKEVSMQSRCTQSWEEFKYLGTTLKNQIPFRKKLRAVWSQGVLLIIPCRNLLSSSLL